jgi:hypothetical protein
MRTNNSHECNGKSFPRDMSATGNIRDTESSLYQRRPSGLMAKACAGASARFHMYTLPNSSSVHPLV